MVETEDNLIVQLEQEYTPLDPALVRTILSDYDFSQPDQLHAARECLETLRASALLEDTILFDPSGTSGNGRDSALNVGKHAGEKSNSGESALSLSGETDTTSISNGLSSLNIGSSSDLGQNSTEIFDSLANLDADGKIARLSELFPTERINDITYTLQKCNGDILQAMDVLLNHVFFSETSLSGQNAVSIRGVDGFSDDQVLKRAKQKKGKNRRFTNLDEYASSSSSSLDQPVNKWETANADIKFLASRTKLSNAMITSTYHQNGASRQKTILALVLQNIAEQKNQSSDDYLLNVDAFSLTEEFPSLTFDNAAALLRLTHPSTAAAHELAKALLLSPTGSSDQVHRFIPQYAPIKLSDEAPSSHLPSPPTSPLLGNSVHLTAARTTAFTKASQYHRKGKSDRLMGGAAAYYASLGRDYHSALQSTTAAEADVLVASQSSSSQLDLHGVSVKDATRIASNKVQQWWDGLGESRIKGGGRKGVGEGYRIVTGMGRHSEGGVSKLGPAVLRMLIREGWKAEVGSGVIVVKGMAMR